MLSKHITKNILKHSNLFGPSQMCFAAKVLRKERLATSEVGDKKY